MFSFLKSLFRRSEAPTATAVKINDQFPVKNPDDAQRLIVELSFKTGKTLYGKTVYNKDGTGTVTIVGEK